MDAEIQQDSPGMWTIAIADITSHDLFSEEFAYGGPATSSEWIEEDPGNGLGTMYPLANFGSVQFENLSNEVSDFTSSTRVDMVDSDGNIVAYPSNFGNDNFTVNYGPPPRATTSILINPATVGAGQAVTYSTTVSGPNGFPTGTVTFRTGSTTLCVATLDAGEGWCSSANAPVGRDVVTGSYSGDLTLSASTSDPVDLEVVGSAASSGYDLVGSDGGVFVFPTGQSGGYYGSLPGMGIHVNNVVGMVPTTDDQGYFLVGADGGVFAFGDAPFENSLPGIGVHVSNIVGIVPTSDDKGYFLVGADGGVFTFGDAPYLGSLPGSGVHVTDIIGIAANPSDTGYWLVAANGTVYSFGSVTNFGSATGSTSPVGAIESTPSGKGYWIVTQGGGVYTFGDAANFGSLPALGITPAHPVIGLVPTADDGGYWLIGSDGGIFAFGDAPFVGSLPGLGVSVINIAGAVPTHI